MPVVQFAGLASGIDSTALIDAVIDAREIRNDLRREQIDGLESENDALEELNTKLLSLNDLVDAFRSVNGGGVARKTSSSDSSILTASAGASALNTTHSLTVNALAKGATASFDDSYSSTDDALAPNASGTVTIGVDVGTGSNQVSVDVDVTSSTTIAEYVDAFNADANASGRVSASLVNVGTTDSPDYRVVFTTDDEGTDLGTLAFDIPGTGSFGGNTDLQAQTISQAANADFEISGITGSISRSSNTVADVITGVTFQLQATGSATITVSDDSDTTGDQVNEIVEAYNDIVEFITENDLIEQDETDAGSGTINIYGSLAKTEVDDEFLTQFRLALSNADSENGTSITSIAQLGISTNRDGTLDFDIDDFKAAVAEDSTGAGELLTNFADDVAGTNNLIYGFTKFNGSIDLAQSGNNAEIENINDAISQLDRQNESIRANLTGRFSRLEATLGELQNAQGQLSSILASL